MLQDMYDVNFLGGQTHGGYNFFTCQFTFDHKPIPIGEREITEDKYKIVAKEINNRSESQSEGIRETQEVEMMKAL